MLKFRNGSSVPKHEQLSEGFQFDGSRIIANVGVDKIRELLFNFIEIHDEPMFFILELHTNRENEAVNQQGQVQDFHNDVYYVDGCLKEEAQAILNRVGEILFNDGLCSFGFGCHDSKDEVVLHKYNLAVIHSSDLQKFTSFFQRLQIPQVEMLVTAESTFTQDQPSSSVSVSTNGEDAYDIPEILSDFGIYFAERRVR